MRISRPKHLRSKTQIQEFSQNKFIENLRHKIIRIDHHSYRNKKTEFLFKISHFHPSVLTYIWLNPHWKIRHSVSKRSMF